MAGLRLGAARAVSTADLGRKRPLRKSTHALERPPPPIPSWSTALSREAVAASIPLNPSQRTTCAPCGHAASSPGGLHDVNLSAVRIQRALGGRTLQPRVSAQEAPLCGSACESYAVVPRPALALGPLSRRGIAGTCWLAALGHPRHCFVPSEFRWALPAMQSTGASRREMPASTKWALTAEETNEGTRTDSTRT